MTQRNLQNTAASVHQRLLNIARKTHRPFDEVLNYFAMERFLYRLSQSQHAASFVLKGALLFRIWNVPDSRATRDIDFLAYTDNTPENLATMIREICVIASPDDGLKFDPDSVSAQRIKEDADYEGVRIRFRGFLGRARISMQVDVGFGDAVHPAAIKADYPTLLDLAAPALRTYTPETVIAEKAEAMIQLAGLNSRMKDFYDLWRLSRQFDFDGATLSAAIQGTFSNRKTSIIKFDELATDLLSSENIDKQWGAFLRKASVVGPAMFSEVLAPIGVFLAPVFASVVDEQPFVDHWSAPGPWRDE